MDREHRAAEESTGGEASEWNMNTGSCSIAARGKHSRSTTCAPTRHRPASAEEGLHARLAFEMYASCEDAPEPSPIGTLVAGAKSINCWES